jgi:hypothetical protein
MWISVGLRYKFVEESWSEVSLLALEVSSDAIINSLAETVYEINNHEHKINNTWRIKQK